MYRIGIILFILCIYIFIHLVRASFARIQIQMWYMLCKYKRLHSHSYHLDTHWCLGLRKTIYHSSWIRIKRIYSYIYTWYFLYIAWGNIWSGRFPIYFTVMCVCVFFLTLLAIACISLRQWHSCQQSVIVFVCGVFRIVFIYVK